MVLSSKDAAKALENRNWMDQWPTDDREGLHVYRFTPSMGGGVYQDRTLFAGQFELFNYDVGGDVGGELGEGRLSIRWPHTKETENLSFTIHKVKGPKPFDLKLTLEGNLRGPSVFFGRSVEGADSSAELFRP